MAQYCNYNKNPDLNRTTDCTVRAISTAMGQTWDATFTGLCVTGFNLKAMPSSDFVWGTYLREHGFCRHLIDDGGKMPYTVRDFCDDHKEGTYILSVVSAQVGHVLVVIDGNYIDTWDSGDLIPTYYWQKCPKRKED